MNPFRVLAATLAAFLILAAPLEANPLNRWKTSCSVDPGSITRQGNTYVFRTSANRCSGGIFAQRAEISTDQIAPTHKGAYRFSTTLSLTSPSSERLVLFQIHDGRLGCGPPLMVRLGGNGQLDITGDYKIGNQPGESCVRDVLSSSGGSAKRIRRDGTEYKFDVIVDFDGQSGYRVYVYLDNALQMTGQYRVSGNPRYFVSKHFYFKHGVYSQHVVPYEMVSRNMRVDKVQLGQ